MHKRSVSILIDRYRSRALVAESAPVAILATTFINSAAFADNTKQGEESWRSG